MQNSELYLKRVYLISISTSSQCVAGVKQHLTGLTFVSCFTSGTLPAINHKVQHGLQTLCVTAQTLTSASSSKAKTNLWRKLFLAHSALPPQHKFQKTMQHQSFDGLLPYPHMKHIPQLILHHLDCFVRNITVWGKGGHQSSLMTSAHNKCKSKSGHKQRQLIIKYFKTSWFILICVAKRQCLNLLRTSFYNNKGKKEIQRDLRKFIGLLLKTEIATTSICCKLNFEMDFS